MSDISRAREDIHYALAAIEDAAEHGDNTNPTPLALVAIASALVAVADALDQRDPTLAVTVAPQPWKMP